MKQERGWEMLDLEAVDEAEEVEEIVIGVVVVVEEGHLEVGEEEVRKGIKTLNVMTKSCNHKSSLFNLYQSSNFNSSYHIIQHWLPFLSVKFNFSNCSIVAKFI